MSTKSGSRAWTFVVLGIGVVVIGGLLARRPAPQRLELVSLQRLTDRLEPIEGAVARLDDGTNELVLVTDAQGQTPWHAAELEAGFELTLMEQSLPGGIALGMLEQVPGVKLAGRRHDGAFWQVSRTQPLAVPVAVVGDPEESVNLWSPPGDHAHWCVVVAQGSTLRFELNVASLLDEEAIRHYFAYRGHAQDPEPAYVRGVVLVMPAVELGAEGVVVVFDLLGDMQSGAVVDAFHFVPSPSVQLDDAPAVEVVAQTSGYIAVRVTGTLRAGHLALVARPGAARASRVFVLEDLPPPVVTPLRDARGSDPVECTCRADEHARARGEELHPSDCEPDVPGIIPGWSCVPFAPAANDCGPLAPSGVVACPAPLRLRSPRICGTAGRSHELIRGRSAKHKLAYDLTDTSSMPGVKLTSGGGFEYGEDSDTSWRDTWTAQRGADELGQCLRYFRVELVCAQPWSQKVPRWIDSGGRLLHEPCGGERQVARICRDMLDTSSVCDRTP